jgi:hypothetical protein
MTRPQYLALCMIGGLAIAALVRTFELERKFKPSAYVPSKTFSA